VGMSQAVMERIFEPFFTTKEIGKGSGLGLSMVYGFIKQSGGHIRVTSELGRGTTFHLYFPKAEVAEIKKAETSAPHVSYQGQGEVVLVVEDDADVRDLAVRYLTTLGYQVIAAIDGPSAKAALRGLARLDFLLTDVVMPKGMSGIDVAKMVESLFPEAKILFMSGYAEDVTGRNTTFDRTVNLIGKPFRKDELARRLRELVTEAA
jgi:CheY-like chemotaxis protein